MASVYARLNCSVNGFEALTFHFMAFFSGKCLYRPDLTFITLWFSLMYADSNVYMRCYPICIVNGVNISMLLQCFIYYGFGQVPHAG